MKTYYLHLFFLLFGVFALREVEAKTDAQADRKEPILVGMTDTTAYFPMLATQRVAVLANRTSVAWNHHLVDLLHERGFEVVGIFSPEHGFRGDADAGETVKNSVDEKTGIPIWSLYNGRTKRPSDEVMRKFDVLVVDMQDVGLRFYTYYISMLRMMSASAQFQKKVIVLDRPNPNGRHIDGPVLEKRYESGVGAIPVPVLHGLTMGEIAKMAIGEGWCEACDLTVIPCRNYRHDMRYPLPIPPSPNLPSERAVALYASLCPFEATKVSIGRGTKFPFEVVGHPALSKQKGYAFSFVPRSGFGAKHPLQEGKVCHGLDFRSLPIEEALEVGFSLDVVIRVARDLGADSNFFTPMFEKLIGVGYVREMILEGASADEIRQRWAKEVEEYKVLRQKYLLYD